MSGKYLKMLFFNHIQNLLNADRCIFFRTPPPSSKYFKIGIISITCKYIVTNNIG